MIDINKLQALFPFATIHPAENETIFILDGASGFNETTFENRLRLYLGKLASDNENKSSENNNNNNTPDLGAKKAQSRIIHFGNNVKYDPNDSYSEVLPISGKGWPACTFFVRKKQLSPAHFAMEGFENPQDAFNAFQEDIEKAKFANRRFGDQGLVRQKDVKKDKLTGVTHQVEFKYKTLGGERGNIRTYFATSYAINEDGTRGREVLLSPVVVKPSH